MFIIFDTKNLPSEGGGTKLFNFTFHFFLRNIYDHSVRTIPYLGFFFRLHCIFFWSFKNLIFWHFALCFTKNYLFYKKLCLNSLDIFWEFLLIADFSHWNFLETFFFFDSLDKIFSKCHFGSFPQDAKTSKHFLKD